MSFENRSIPVAVERTAPNESMASHSGTEDAVAPASMFLTPPIDIHEGPDGLILEADLPGVAEKGVNIQLEDNVLSLRAHVTSPAPEGARTLHQEYQVGDFYRSFILSDEVERGRISAELRNGVLRLT